MSDECEICDGDKWIVEGDYHDWDNYECEHCDGTGIEPDTACCDGRSGLDDRSMR